MALASVASAADDLVVGVIASRGSPGGAAQTLVATSWAAQARAAGGVFGTPVRVLVADDGGSPEGAAQAARAQIADGALALVCCTTPAASWAVAAVAEAEGALLLTPTPLPQTLPNAYWTFSLAPSDTDVLAAIVAEAYKRGRTSLALLAPDLPLADSASESLEALGRLVGIQLAADVRYAAGQADLRPEALLAASSRPGGVVVWGFTEDLERASSALERRGYEGDVYGRSLPFYLTTGAPSRTDVVDMLMAVPPAAIATQVGAVAPLPGADGGALGPCYVEASRDARRLADVPGAAAQALVTAPVLAGLDLLRSAFEQLLALQIPTDDEAVVRQAVRDAVVGLPATCTGAGSIDLEEGRLSAVQPRGLVIGRVAQTGLVAP